MHLQIPVSQLVRLQDEVRVLAEIAGDLRRQIEAFAVSTEREARRLATMPADAGESGDGPLREPRVEALHGWTERLDSANRLAASARRQHATAVRLLTYLGGNGTPAGRSHRRPVLVVDDSDQIRQCVTRMLERAGYKVGTAGNGLEGLLAAHEMRPCVILMDLTLPVLDGIEATRLIKATDTARDARIIAHTGMPAAGNGRDDGLFDAVLEKPASAETLIATVSRFAHA
jgi:CheY-like chemotaxis protein